MRPTAKAFQMENRRFIDKWLEHNAQTNAKKRTWPEFLKAIWDEFADEEALEAISAAINAPGEAPDNFCYQGEKNPNGPGRLKGKLLPDPTKTTWGETEIARFLSNKAATKVKTLRDGMMAVAGERSETTKKDFVSMVPAMPAGYDTRNGASSKMSKDDVFDYLLGHHS